LSPVNDVLLSIYFINYSNDGLYKIISKEVQKINQKREINKNLTFALLILSLPAKSAKYKCDTLVSEFVEVF